ncbi:MAG: heavy-metal-associated domain-containing protein [Deltaproteobacteria bacterium]|uniref:Heavy-metal-associated domain-containing protein n=1 Tax=Candidatus Zymogenus saltonus TaxID=2844893 RepID=A0A9D8KCH0_9DELT|nr:heavy-metal-associated domain-containing protein [Candidatus Zymogenus saltonus]
MRTIKIKGMSCGHCVKAVTEALEGVDGVENVSVSLEMGEATFDEYGTVDMDVVREVVEDAGYEVG